MLLGAEQQRCSVLKLAVALLLVAEQQRCSVLKLAVTLLLGGEQQRCSVLKLAVTLSQLSYRAAVANSTLFKTAHMLLYFCQHNVN